MIYQSGSSHVHKKSNNLDTMVHLYHTPTLSSHQCGSTLVQTTDAPLPLVWSMVRGFNHPQSYKQFIKGCNMHAGDGSTTGSVREVTVVSGLPAETSTERLDLLDDELHVMVFSIIGGDHRLKNYQSTTTVHEDDDGRTVVIESYVVDVAAGSSGEETCIFANTIIGCNLRCLAKISEQKAY